MSKVRKRAVVETTVKEALAKRATEQKTAIQDPIITTVENSPLVEDLTTTTTQES